MVALVMLTTYCLENSDYNEMVGVNYVAAYANLRFNVVVLWCVNSEIHGIASSTSIVWR